MKIKKAKKVLLQLLFVFSLALTCIIFTPYKANASVVNGFNFKAGDIIVTSSTSSAGLTGHAGIVLPDGTNIVHIAGPGHRSSKISISQWLKNFPKTKVVRPNDSLTGLGASYFGENYFLNGAGKNIDYAITPGLTSTSKMYCSKLVWQCYNGAGLSFKAATTNIAGDRIEYFIPAILSPYDFINSYAVKYNGFKIMKSFNW